MYTPITVPFSDTGEHHGIFSKLRKTHKIDLLGKNYLNLSSSKYFDGEISTLINHGDGFYRSTSDGESTYIQIAFLRGLIYPTGYTLRGREGTYHFAKSWYVYGIRDGDENNKERWEILGENDTTQSTYCALVSPGGGCIDNRVGSFSLKPMSSSSGYKYLRWTLKEGCCNDSKFLTLGVDVYGTLFLGPKKPRTCLCYCKNNNVYMFLFLLYEKA